MGELGRVSPLLGIVNDSRVISIRARRRLRGHKPATVYKGTGSTPNAMQNQRDDLGLLLMGVVAHQLTEVIPVGDILC